MGVEVKQQCQFAAKHKRLNISTRQANVDAHEMQASKAATDFIGGHSRSRVKLSDVNAASYQINNSRSNLLQSSVRADLESFYDADLSAVRVHTDAAAAEAANVLNARAFVSGAHIYFGLNEYKPDSVSGKHLIAHEVAHTLQQASRPSPDLDFSSKVIDQQGSGLPQCWPIPLTSTENIPSIEDILDHHIRNLPSGFAADKTQEIRLLLMNHNEAVRNDNVSDYWAGIAALVISERTNSVLKRAVNSLTGNDDQYLVSALYDCLKASTNYRAAAYLLNLYPTLKTTFFSAEAYGAFAELKMHQATNGQNLKNSLYETWYSEPWFGRANPRFMMDLVLHYLLSPSAGLARAKISSQTSLNDSYARNKLDERLNFGLQSNELFYMTVLVAAQVEKARYGLLRRALRSASAALGDGVKNRGNLKRKIIIDLGLHIIRRREAISDAFNRRGTGTLNANDTATETYIIILQDLLLGMHQANDFAGRFWASGNRLSQQASAEGATVDSITGGRLSETLDQSLPGFRDAINLFVLKILEEPDPSLPDPLEFNRRRETAIEQFLQGYTVTRESGENIRYFSIRSIERAFSDKFFDAYPIDRQGQRGFSFNQATANRLVNQRSRKVVAWALNVSHELLFRAGQYEPLADLEMVRKQQGILPNVVADDIRRIFRLRFARKLLVIANQAGWDHWKAQAMQVLSGAEFNEDYIALGSDWVEDSGAHLSVINHDLGNRSSDTIGGLAPLSKQDLINYVLADDYRSTTQHINNFLGQQQGNYDLTNSSVMSQALEAAKQDDGPKRYIISNFELVIMPREDNDNSAPAEFELLGQHVLTQGMIRNAQAQLSEGVIWIANLVVDSVRHKPVCVLWIIPSPIDLIARLQQIDALNQLLVARLQFIFNSGNQSLIDNARQLLRMMPFVRESLEGEGALRENSGQNITGPLRLESLTADQLKAVKPRIWWRVVDFLNRTLVFSPDDHYIDQLRLAVSSTNLSSQLRSERVDALNTLKLSARKATSHERRRRIETSIRVGLSEYESSNDQFQIPGYERESVKRFLAEDTVGILSDFLFGITDQADRESHTAMAILELSETLLSVLEDDNNLNAIHAWLPLIDLALAWSQDSSKGGNQPYRTSFTVAEEVGNETLYNQRVTNLENLLTNMAETLRENIRQWGIVGRKGDGTVENTGSVQAVGNSHRSLQRGQRFVIDGTAWEIMEVMQNFTFHPAAFPMRSRLNSQASPAGSVLILNGVEYSSQGNSSRPDVPLLRVKRNDSNRVEELRAIRDEAIITQLSWSVQMQVTVAQLQDLAEAIEFGAELTVDLAELFPVAGPAIAATRLITAGTMLINNDVPKMIADVATNPQAVINNIFGQFRSVLSINHLLEYLIFSNDNNIGLRVAEGHINSRITGSGRSRKWRRLARKLQSFVAGVTRVFTRTQDNVQDRRQAVEHLVQGSPVASYIVAFLADHYHEVVGIVSRLDDAVDLDPAQLLEFGQMRAQLTPANLEDRFNGMIEQMGSIVLPKDILPLEEIVHALIDIIGHRLGGKYKLGIRVLLALLDAVGATDQIVGGISRAIKSGYKDFTGNTLTDDILPQWNERNLKRNIEPRLNSAQNFVAETLENIFGSFGINLDLDDPVANITLSGTDFGQADPNAPEAQPSLENDVKNSLQLNQGQSMNFEQAGELLKRLPGLGGQPIPESMRVQAELRFGQDFSDVRLHHSNDIGNMMSSIGVNGLTSGSHIMLSDASFLGLDSQRILFHELAHVIQQTGVRPLGRSGRRSPQVGRGRGGIRVDPQSEAEADVAAMAALKGDVRHVRLTSNSGMAQPNMVELFGVRFLRQLTDVGALQSEVAEIDESQGTNAGRLIGADVRRAVSHVSTRLNTIFSNASTLNIDSKFRSKRQEIKQHLQNNRLNISNAVEDIAINASYIARRGRDGNPPTMGLDVNDFTRRLERYILGKTGIMLSLNPNTDNRTGRRKRFRSVNRPYNSANVTFIFLPAIHANSSLWRDLIMSQYPELTTSEQKAKKRRLIRSVLRDFGTSASVWITGYRLSEIVNQAVERLESIVRRQQLDLDSLPTPTDYLDTDATESTPGGVGNIRLHLGIFNEKRGPLQKGRERESHHITQYLLLQYFHNGSSGEPEQSDINKKAFPLLDKNPNAYPGLDVVAGRPVKFNNGGTDIQIASLEQGRGGLMPTILLATPTHRRGNLHLTPKADETRSGSNPSQAIAINHIYTKALPNWIRDMEKEVAQEDKPYSDWEGLVTRRGEGAVKNQIGRSMQATYKHLRDYMQSQLKAALKGYERDYYNDLDAEKNGQSSTPGPVTLAHMEEVWRRAKIHNRSGRNSYRGMNDYGWRG